LISRANARVDYTFGITSREADSPDSLVVEVTPATGVRRWLGRFEVGTPAATATWGVFSLPDPARFLVVAGGQAYSVVASDPDDWDGFRKPFPITHVLRASDPALVLLVDFTNIAAIGPGGLAWSSERLSSDGIVVKALFGRSLVGVGWSAPDERDVEFELDLTTGKHRGGPRT
jgi:hypothetical protein